MEDKIILRLNNSGNKYVDKAYKDAKGIIWGIPWFLFLNFILAGKISLDYSNEIPYIVFVSMSIITTLYCVFAYFLQTRKTGFYVREIRLSQDFITIETAKYLLGKDISLSKCRAKMGKFTVTNQKWFDRPWMWRETESLLLNSEGETFTVVLEFFPPETKECIMKALQEEK